MTIKHNKKTFHEMIMDDDDDWHFINVNETPLMVKANI